MMTLEEQRDIIQAAIDGKKVKFESFDGVVGGNITSHHGFNFNGYYYRVVEPPVEYVKFESTGGNVQTVRKGSKDYEQYRNLDHWTKL